MAAVQTFFRPTFLDHTFWNLLHLMTKNQLNAMGQIYPVQIAITPMP
jgi:hypothetical protein